MELMLTTLDSRPPATERQPPAETLFQDVLGQFRAVVDEARLLDERGWEDFWSIVGIRADRERVEFWTRGVSA